VFDTVIGLPLHPLVVHAVVVLLPLAALATIAVAVRAPWRRFAPLLMVLNAGVMIAAWVAVQSGQALEHRVEQFSQPSGLQDHAAWGKRLLLLSVALFVGAVVIWFARRADGLAMVVGVLAVIGAVGIVVITVYVGHSGATMVWKNVIANTRSG